MKIVIAGSQGFIGSHLTSYFNSQGHELVLLSRQPNSIQSHFWNPESKEIDPTLLEGADVVINLAGENIFGRWSEKKKDKIRESRLNASQFLCDTLLSLKAPPTLYIGASAIGYYGDRPDEEIDESSSKGGDFLADVCADWEKVAETLTQKNIRVVYARFGIVLGSGGGALKALQKGFSTGMGGTLGSGQQIMSWIAIDDLASAISYIIEHREISGAVNFTAPNPVSNQVFTEQAGKVLNRPTLVPVPKFALNLLFGEGSMIFLASQRVLPKKLLDAGYQFKYPAIEEALKKYLRNNA